MNDFERQLRGLPQTMPSERQLLVATQNELGLAHQLLDRIGVPRSLPDAPTQVLALPNRLTLMLHMLQQQFGTTSPEPEAAEAEQELLS